MKIGNAPLTQWQNFCVVLGMALSFLAVIVYFKTAESAKGEKPLIRQVLEVPKIEIAKTYSISQLLKKARTASAESISLSEETQIGEKINLNTADYSHLMQISGMREEIAKSILDYRKKMGEIWELEELKDLPGVNDAFIGKIRKKVTLE